MKAIWSTTCWSCGWRALGAVVLITSLSVAHAEEGDSLKALKYHKLLVKRPEPGYLFDRFYNTWLDESTVDALGEFLHQRAQQSEATPDQLLLAFFYSKKGDDVAAIQLFDDALADNPASAATWYHKALVEARTLDFEGAIGDLRKARERSPDEKLAVQIDKQLGKLLVRNRQTTEALEVWRALLDSRPGDDQLAEDLLELYIDEGLLDEAAALAETLLKQTSDPHLKVMRQLRLGDIHHRAGEREKAIDVYTQSLDDVGSETWLEREILAQVDQVMRREDDLNGLKRLYDELAKEYPKRVGIHRRRAHLLLEVGDVEPGLAAFREVLKLTPGHRPTREEYVTILAKAGKTDDALKELKALCEQNAEDAELRFRLLTLLQEAKRTDEVAAAADEYLTASDGSEYAHLRAARALERMDDKQAAERIYREMAEKFADSASAQDAYAAFLYTAGKKDEALSRWRKLAEKAELGQLLHVARTLSARHEHQSALDLLKAREGAFDDEPLFLGQLISTAIALKQFDAAVPWALARVKLAREVADMETAVDQAADTIERADQLEAVAAELTDRNDRTMTETCLLAELWERTGDSRRADEVLQKAAESGNVLAVSEQIRLASQRREWAAAADATRRMLDLPGGRKSLYVRRLVELYQRDFQLEEALKWVQEWKRLSPGSTTPWVTEARLLSGLGKPEEALKVLRVASAQFEDDEDLRVRLAEMYAESGKHADAERIFWQLYEDNDDLADKLRWSQEIAKLAEQQGTTEQIIENFNQRIESNRRSIVPWLALSEVYRVVNDHEGRRRALTAAAKIKPDDIHLLQQIARAEEQDGDWQAAIKTLERAVPLDKTNRTREQIAQLNLRYGDEEVGFSQLLELANETSDPRSLETAADTLCGMRDWERAAQFLQSRLVDHPQDYRLRYLAAVALEEAGDNDAALELFLELLDGQEELSSKQRMVSPAAVTQSYFSLVREILPPRAADWFELMQHRYTAYAYRQQGQAYISSSAFGGMGVRSAIQMPANVDAVRPMAIVHALSIGAMLEEDMQQELWRELESHGLEHAEALSALDPQRGDFTGPLTEILEKDSQNEIALAVMVMQGLNGSRGMDDEYLSSAVDKFRTSYPQLALLAAIRAGVNAAAEQSSVDEATPTNKFLDEALAIADTIKSPNAILAMGVTAAIGGQTNGGVAAAIDAKYQRKFSALIIKWYPHLINSPYGQYAYFMVVQTLSKNDDPTAYVQFLDDEAARYQAGTNRANSRSNSIQMMLMSRNQQQMLAPPAFPPTQLAHFPNAVLVAFSTTPGMNPLGQAMEPPGGIAEPAVKIKPLLDKVKSPVLRLMLAHHAELDDVVEKEINQLLAAPSPNVDTYLLAAGLAAEKENFPRAVQFLDKARYLPMSQEMRRYVDGSLVGAVLVTDAETRKAAPELVESGKQASLRLRRAQLDQRVRSELIAAMEELGLKKEAKKLDELAAQTASSVTAIRTYSAATVATPPDRIAKLMADGKRDVAIRLLAGELTGQVQQMLANVQNARSYRYRFRELKQRIDSLGLASEVLASLEDKDAKNPRRLLEYGMACELFDLKDKARAQYERVLELRPRDDAARMQLIMLLGLSEPASAHEHIKQLSKSARDAMPQALANQLQDYESSVEDRIGYAALLVELLKVLEPGDISPQSYGFEYAVSTFGRQLHTNQGAQLPSLYLREPEENRSSRRTISQEIVDERERVHEQLCRELLNHPETARAGFKHLLAYTEAKGAATDEFADLAKKILLDATEARPGRGAITRQFSYSTNTHEVRFREPEEFLVDQAWKTDDWTMIDETLLPKLDAAKTRAEHDRLKTMSVLYRCREDEFVDHAKSFARRPRSPHPAGASDELDLVSQVWIDRKLAVDLEPLVMTQLKRDVNGQNHHQPPAYLVTYLEGLAHAADRAELLAVLDEVATIYMAPRETRNDFVRKHYQPNNINWATPNGRIYVFGQLVEQLCQRGELLFAVLEHLQHYEISPVRNLEYRIQEAFARGDGAPGVMQLLERSPWLEDLDSFEPLDVAGGGDRAPLARLLQVTLSTDEVRAELRKLIAERQASQETFGSGLILAFIDQKQDQASLLTYLGEHLPAIEQLPERKQTQLAAMASDLLHASATTAKDLGPTALAAKEWLERGRSAESELLLARVEKAKRLEELGIEHGQIYEFARETLGPTIVSDPVAAVKIFDRVCELAREAQRHGQWYMHVGGGQSTAGSILEQVSHYSNQQKRDWNCYNFVADVVMRADGSLIEVDGGATNIIARAMNVAFHENPPDKKSPDECVLALYEELGGTIGKRPSSLLIAALYNNARGMNEKECRAIRDWAAGEIENGKYPEVARDIDTAVALVASEKGDSRADKLPKSTRRELADYHERLLNLMSDTKLPITWRLHLATFISRCQADRMPLEVARRVVALHAEAMDANAPITHDQNRHLTRGATSLIAEPTADGEMAVWRENWATRFLKARQRSSDSRRENFHDLTHGDAICDALIVFLAADDGERTEKLSRKYTDQMARLPRAFAALVRAKKADLAADFVVKHWPTLDFHWPDDPSCRYDVVVAAAAPPVFEAIESAEIRYFAELMLASMPDAKGESDAGDADGASLQAERMDALVPKIEEMEFKNEACHKRVLVLLSRNDATRDAVADRVAQLYNPANLTSAFHSNNDSVQLTHETQLAVCHFGNQFLAGKASDFVSMLKQLIAGSTQDNYQFTRRLVPVLESFRSVLGKPTEPLTPEDCSAIAAELRNIFKDRDYLHFNDSRSFNNLLVAMHSQAGEAELANEWVGTVNNNCRRVLEQNGVNDDIWKFGLQLNATAAPENLQNRLRYIENVLRYTLARKWIHWNLPRTYYLEHTGDYPLFEGITRAGLMSDEELKDHGDELVERVDNLPYVTAAWAVWLAKHKEPARAAEHWQAVVEAEFNGEGQEGASNHEDVAVPRVANKQTPHQAFQVYQLATALVDSEQAEAAVEALELLDGKDIPQPMKNQVQKLREKLSTAAEEKAQGANLGQFHQEVYAASE